MEKNLISELEGARAVAESTSCAPRPTPEGAGVLPALRPLRVCGSVCLSLTHVRTCARAPGWRNQPLRCWLTQQLAAGALQTKMPIHPRVLMVPLRHLPARLASSAELRAPP